LKVRAVTAVVVFLLVLFCGCSKLNSEKTPVTSGFSSDVEIKINDLDYFGKLTYSNSNDFVIELTSPDIVSGLKIVFEAGQPTVTYKGINCTNLYDFSAASMISEALKELEVNGVFDAEEGIYDCGDFIITVNDAGFITEIDVKDYNAKIFLSNHKLI